MSGHGQLGEVIAARRRQLGYGQLALAGKVDVTQQTVSRWESAVNTPTVEALERLATALTLDRDRLFRLAGYYPEPISETDHEHSFDTLLSDLATYPDDQLAELLDYAQRILRQRAAHTPPKSAGPVGRRR